MKSKLMYLVPRLAAVALVSFWVFYVFLTHGFTATAFVESSIWMVVLGATMIAWGNHISGAVIFILLGIGYWLMVKDVFQMNTILYVAAPLILTGALFILDKYLNNNKQVGGKKK